MSPLEASFGDLSSLHSYVTLIDAGDLDVGRTSCNPVIKTEFAINLRVSNASVHPLPARTVSAIPKLNPAAM